MGALPTSIGRYRPLALLGSGAMGSVYRAHDPLIDRMVAVKVVRIDSVDVALRDEFLERFRQEVQAAGRCSHPGIVGVYDYVADAEEPSIVMELVEGRSLQQIFRDAEARASLQVVPIVLQVLEGLGYAHGQGVIHRDIKPANIIVTPAGQAKIADFGIARLNEAAMTHTGAMLGTPHYMAPEQVSDDEVDRRADLFAVGAILYEYLVGRPPFAGRSLAETIQRLSGPAEADLAPIAGDPAYAGVLQRALAKDRSKRFATADAFAAALQAAAEADQPTIVRPARTLARDPAHGRTQDLAHDSATRGSASGAAGRAPPVRVWDPALLQRAERQLAALIGPMARNAVAKAAEASASAEEVYATLARGLPNADDRRAFLRAMGGARVEPSMTVSRRMEPSNTASRRVEPTASQSGRVQPANTLSRRVEPASTAAPATTASGSGRFPPEALSVAQSVLTFYVGPIARVLVRDAAAASGSATEFIDRLCGHVAKPDEAAALRQRLRAQVEPKLRG